MIRSTNFGAMVGAPVLGPEDQRIGTVGQVFVDPNDGHPNWITVRTGWIGKSESFVPLDTADWDEERVHVKYDKEFIKGAPRVDTDGALTEPEERELYRHYGIAVDGDHPAGQSDDPTGGSPSAYLDTPGGSHSDRPSSSDYSHTGTGRHSAGLADDGSSNSTDVPPKPGMRRMRRFVVTEIEVDEEIPEDELGVTEEVEWAERPAQPDRDTGQDADRDDDREPDRQQAEPSAGHPGTIEHPDSTERPGAAEHTDTEQVGSRKSQLRENPGR